MYLFLFGSTGTIVEMGRLERLAFNAAFNELDLNLYWNVATYFKLNELSSSPESLMALVGDEWATGLAEEVLECKQEHLTAYLQGGIAPREGVLDTVRFCKREGIRLGWATDSPAEHVQMILEATTGLSDNTFDKVFTLEDLPARKPDAGVYPFVIDKFDCSAGSVVAVEDTPLNQSSALMAGIQCYLYPGEYSSVDRDILLTRDLRRTVEVAHQSWAYKSRQSQNTSRESIAA
jgi:FMN phosphatase YigB (HAD superfamily)